MRLDIELAPMYRLRHRVKFEPLLMYLDSVVE